MALLRHVKQRDSGAAFPKSCSLAGTEAAHTEQQSIILHVTARDA